MPTLLLIIIFVSFISLGLPDATLGAAWPAMYSSLHVSIAAAGVISFAVTIGTIVSSLASGVVLRRFGTGRVNQFSTLMTGISLVGFALSPSLVWMLVFSIPLGLGAGSVDAGMNSYVALHYKAHHMNWLHSFWGLGATLGPIIMAQILLISGDWRVGYWTIGGVQLSLAAILFISLPLWAKVDRLRTQKDPEMTVEVAIQDAPEAAAATEAYHHANPNKSALKLRQTPGLLLALAMFLVYCGAEISMGLWGSSFLVQSLGLSVTAAGLWVSLYFAGITVGRFLSGFLALKWQTRTLMRAGILISLGGAILLLLSGLLNVLALPAFVLIGLGFAPIFPGMIHETPRHFGTVHSQQIIGYQMAAAYVGITIFPPLIGPIAAQWSLWIMPILVLIATALLYVILERLIFVTTAKR
ncbi:MAG: MFS transporter [Eubacteriales bacterium]|nr:MFS transporter [Eubacteriales bacterium]